MYTGPKIEITGYQKGSILKPDEIDALRGGQDTAMGVMLDKLDKRSKLEKEVSKVSEHDVKLYKLRKKLENTSDSAEYLKIAKEIGYNNLTSEQMEHVKSIEFWDDPLQATIDNIKETGKGFIDGVVDAGEKLDEAGEKYLGPVYKSVKGSAVAGYDLAKDFVDGGIQLGWNIGWTIDHLHKDPQVVLDTVLGYDYKGAFMSMVDTLAEKWDEKVVHGDAYSRAHYFTYMIGSLWGLKSGKSSVSTGSKDLAKAGKAAVNKAKKAGKTIKQSIKPPNNRYTPALQGILQDAPNSINVKNTPLIRELVEDKKKSVLFNSNKGTSGQTVKKVRKTIVPTVKSGEFNKWFNTLSTKQLDELWSDKKIRRAIERQLRAPGGMHEWHLVSRAPTFKHWGVTAEQIRELRTAINEVEFVNPTGKHGGLGSTAAHNELLKIIDSSKDYNMFVRRLNNWANYRLKGGVEALPEGLRIKK